MQFVEEFAGGEAVVELAEESVEQMSLSLMVPISASAASVEMPSGSGGRFRGAERPDRSRCCQSPVLDVPVQDEGFLPAGTGDRGSTGVGLESARSREPVSVVTDLRRVLPGSGECAEPGKLVMIFASGCSAKSTLTCSARVSAAVQAASNCCSNVIRLIPIAASVAVAGETPGRA